MKTTTADTLLMQDVLQLIEMHEAHRAKCRLKITHPLFNELVNSLRGSMYAIFPAPSGRQWRVAGIRGKITLINILSKNGYILRRIKTGFHVVPETSIPA